MRTTTDDRSKSDDPKHHQGPTTYRIHPSIGLARVGDSPTSFYLGPESAAALPIECDQDTGRATLKDGQYVRVKNFKDSECRVRRQAARFKIYVYDQESKEGRELKKGDTIQGRGSSGPLVNIEWTAYLANKKAAWYQFKELEGEHGYAPNHPLRNADVGGAEARQMLIIDPGPQTVYDSPPSTPTSNRPSSPGGSPKAEFRRGENPGYAQTFPPPLKPHSIDTLGQVMTDGDLHLLVLGGHGNSGSCKQGLGHPRIQQYANNPGWFDDLSDGPVSAKLIYWDELDDQYRYVAAERPAWVIVGQPGYVPELANIITLDDLLYDLSVRHFAYDTYLYGTPPFDCEPPHDLEQWREKENYYNPDYYPKFFREVWPLLRRPHTMRWLTSYLEGGSDPHETGMGANAILGGSFDVCKISVPPYHGQDCEERDHLREMRMYIYESLRKPGEENQYKHAFDRYKRISEAPLMPLLCGDNPLDNTLPSKFLRLTDTQLFLVKQWAQGKFVNECKEGWVKCEPVSGNTCSIPPESYINPPPTNAAQLDRAVLANALGGSFCPGGEVGWIMRNPAIYAASYRINANLDYTPSMEASLVATTPGVTLYERQPLSYPTSCAGGCTPNNAGLSAGLEPGDVTKYNALPWQGDFNECSTQPIDVTYEEWAVTYPEDPDAKVTNKTLWWPAHRPLQVQIQLPPEKPGGQPGSTYVQWTRGIPADPAGDLKMVSAWKDLGFIINVSKSGSPPNYVQVDRNDAALGGQTTLQGCQLA